MADLTAAADISHAEDLDPRFGMVTGINALKHSLFRRLNVEEEGLSRADVGAITYGYSLTELIGKTFTSSELALVAARIAAECMKDERVNDARVSLELDPFTQNLSISISILTSDDTDLSLIIAVSDTGTQLL